MSFRAPRLLGLLLFGCLSVAAWGTTYTWNSGGDGTTWTDQNNWGGSGYPGNTSGQSDVAQFAGTTGVTITGYSFVDTAPDLSLSSGASITMPAGTLGNLTVNASTLTLSGNLVTTTTSLQSTATLAGSNTLSGTTLNLGDGTGAVTIPNTIALQFSGTTTINVGTGNGLTTLTNGSNSFVTVSVTAVAALTLVSTTSVTVSASSSTSVGGALSVTSSGGNVTVGSDIAAGGNISLIPSSTGNVVVQGQLSVTGTSTITLGTNGASGQISLASSGTVASTVNGNITFNLAVVLQQDSTITISAPTGTQTILFRTTVTGNSGTENLTANAYVNNSAVGRVTFTGTVGVVGSGLASVQAYAGSRLRLGGNVTTTGLQTYGGTVNLNAATITLTSSNNGSITFSSLGTLASAVNPSANGDSLTINSGTGNIIFTGTLGAPTTRPVLSMTGGGGGNFIQLSGTVTANSVSFSGPVQLENSITVSTATNNGAVQFTQTVDGSSAGGQSLTVTSGTGAISFGGAIGGTNSLSTLLPTSSTGITIQNVTTTGVQTYSGPVILGANATLQTTGSTVTFTSTITGTTSGGQFLSVSTGVGKISIGGAVGATPLASISLTSTFVGTTAITVRSVTTSGTQTYAGQVTLGANAVFTTTNNNVGFIQTVDGAGFTLQVIAGTGGGAVSFGGAIGGTGVPASVTVTSSLSVGIANVKTSGAQSYTASSGITLNSTTYTSTGGALTFTGPVTLTTAATVVTSGGGAGNNITFSGTTSTINGLFDLTLNGGASGNVSLQGAVGATNALTSLTVSTSGASNTLGIVNVSTTSFQNYTAPGGITLNGTSYTNSLATAADFIHFNNAVKVKATPTTVSSDGGVTFGSTVDDGNTAGTDVLTVSNVSGSAVAGVTLTGAVGTTSAALQSLTVTTQNAQSLAMGNVKTTSFQNYTAPGGITLNSTTYTSTGGAITFSNAISMTQNGTTITSGGGATQNILFSSTVDGTHDLTLNAGTSGNVTFTGDVGASFKPTALTINTAAGLTIDGNIKTTSDITMYIDTLTMPNAATKTVDLAGTGTLYIYTKLGAGTIDIGTTGAGLSVTETEWASIRNALQIVVGKQSAPTQQSGQITFTNALVDPSMAAVPLTVNTTGTLAFNDSGVQNALASGGSGTMTFNAGTISVIQPMNASYADISTTGKVTITTTGKIGLSGYPLQFPDGENNLQISSANDVYLAGLGALTLGGSSFGAVSNSGTALLNVTTQGISKNLTLANQVSMGTGSVTLNATGLVIFNYSTAAVITATSSTVAIQRPLEIDADASITMSSGTAAGSITFQSTVDSKSGSNFALTVTAGNATVANQESVVFTGDIGTAQALKSLTVANASTVTAANVGSAAQDGVVQALSVQGSSGVTLKGSYYKTTGSIASSWPQTWQAGVTASAANLTVNQTAPTPVLFQTQGKLNLYGNFLSTASGANVTLIGNDMGINPAGTAATSTYGVWSTGSNTLSFYSYTRTQPMSVGIATATADAAGQWHLDLEELTSLNNSASSYGRIIFGDPTAGTGQSGSITIQTVDLSASNAGAGVAVDINSLVSGGSVFFSTNSNTSDALRAGSGTINVNAYASIDANQVPNTPTSTFSDLVTTGAINLNTDTSSGLNIGAGPVATYASGYTGYKPIAIKTGSTVVNVSGKNTAGVFLMGVGTNVVLGTVNIGGTLTTDLYGNNGVIYITQNISSNGNDVVYVQPVQLQATATIDTSTGGSAPYGNITFESTLDDFTGSSGTHTLTLSAGTKTIQLIGAVGGTTPIGGLSITSAGAVHTYLSVKTSTAGGGTGNVSIVHTGTLTMDDATSTADVSNYDYVLAGTFSESGGGGVSMAADLTTSSSTAAAVTFNDAITLTGAVQVQTTSGTANQLFVSTIDGGIGPYAFYTDGTGTKTFQGAIGSTTNLAAFTSTSAGTLKLQNDLSTSGAISLADTTVQLDSTSASPILSTGTTGSITISNAWTVLPTSGSSGYTIQSTFATASHVFGAGTITAGKNLVFATTGTGTVASLTGITSNLTIKSVGGLTFSGAVAVQTVTLNQTGTINFSGGLTTTGPSGAVTQAHLDAINTGAGTTNFTSAAAVTINGNLSLTSAGTIAVTTSASPVFTVTGTTTVGSTTLAGTLDLGKAAATSSLGTAGSTDVVVTGLGILKFDQSNVTVQRDLLAQSVLSGSSIDFGTATVTIGRNLATSTAAASGSALTFNQGTVTVNNNVDFSVGSLGLTLSTSAVTPSSVTIKGSTANFNTAGTITDLATSDNTITIQSGGATALTSHATNRLGNLVVTGASTNVTFTNGGAALNNNATTYTLTVNSGANLTWSANNFITANNATLGATGSGTVSATGSAGFKVGNNLTLGNASTLSIGTGGFAVLQDMLLNGSGTVSLSTASGAANFTTPASNFQVTRDLTWGAAATSNLDLVNTTTSTAAFIVGRNLTNPAGAGGTISTGTGRFTVGSLSSGSLSFQGSGAITENNAPFDVWAGVTLGTSGNFTKNMGASALFEFGDPSQASTTTSTVALGTNTDLGKVWVYSKATVNNTTLLTFKTDALDVAGQMTVASAGGTASTMTSAGDAAILSGGTLTIDASQWNTQNVTTAAGPGTLVLKSSAAVNGGITVPAGETIANNGTFTIGTTFAGSTLTLSGTGAGSNLTGNDISKTGDFTLQTFFYAATPFTVPVSRTVTLGDAANTFVGVTLVGTLNANSKNFSLSGSWDNSAATGALSNPAQITFNNTASVTVNSGASSAGVGTGKNFNTVIFGGTGGTLQLSGPLAAAGSVTKNSGSVVDLNAQTLLVQGNLTLNGTAAAEFLVTGSTVSLNAPSSAQTVTIAAPTAIIFNNLLVNAPGGVTQGSNLKVNNRFAVFRGIWTSGGHNLAVGEDFVAYGAGFKDYVINGTTYYAADDGELAATRSSTYIANKLGYPYWTGATAGAGQSGSTLTYYHMDTYNALVTTAFGLPAFTVWGGTVSAGLGANSAVTSWTSAGTSNATATFQFTGGETVTVGRNFYNYGASMNDSGAAWTLSLPTKWTAGSSAVNAGVSWTGVTLNETSPVVAKTTDWFGVPFAVAISSVGSTMQIQNAHASQIVAAAQTTAGGVYAPGNTTTSPTWTSAVSLDAVSLANKWDNTQADIDTRTANLTMTRFDNLVEVGFTKPLKNALGEMASAVGTGAANVDDVRFNSGANNAGATYLFNTYTVNPIGPSEGGATYSAGTLPADDLETRVAFKTLTGISWNTDATGTSGGLGATTSGQSTNRSGVSQTTVPNVSFEKGRLYDASGNPVVNRDGVNFNAAYSSAAFPRYTATLDLARPVLVKIALGQAEKDFPAKYAEDGHNYWHLVWSEPVDLFNTSAAAAATGINTVGSQIGSIPGSQQAAGNLTVVSGSGFGDSYTSTAGTVQLLGIANYTGNLYRGSRAQNAGDVTLSQGTVTPTNAMARSSVGNDLYIYLTGASTSSGINMAWDGFWWGDTTSPTASTNIYTVISTYVDQVKDRSGNANPVEDSNVSWPAASGSADPKTTFALVNDPSVNTGAEAVAGTTIAAHTGWEFDAPSFAQYTPITSPPYSYEVVPLNGGSGNPDLVDQVQFHVLANTANSGQVWNSTAAGNTPDGTATHFGIRDTSLTSFPSGLSLGLSTDTTMGVTTYNLAMTGTGNTSVNNTLFTVPASSVDSTADDGYFTLPLSQTAGSGMPATWKPTAAFRFFYSQFAGMATNLAGRLLPSTAAGGQLAIDRTPPYITLTLAAVGSKLVYVQLSRQSVALDPGPSAVYKNIFALSGTTNTIASVTFRNPSTGLYGTSNAASGFQEAVITLTSPLAAADVTTATLAAVNYPNNANGNSTITATNNDMDWTKTYPITFVGVDLVQPVWASDGSGGEANTTGTARVIHDFTGLAALTANDITMQASIQGTNHYTLPLRLFYDLNVPPTLIANNIWLPLGFYQPSGVTSKVPTKADNAVRYVDPSATNSGGNLRTFVIPGGDSEIKDGGELQFVFRLGSLYTVRSTDPTDPTQLGVYRIPLKGVKEQKNGVTILHNVIDPTQGQETQILYTMKRAGVVTVQVFALDGSLVAILHRGRQASGDYSLTWNGKNSGGRIVARGIYFIRVVAPDTDETRNVLVIK